MRVPDALLRKAGFERAAGARAEVVVAGHFDEIHIWSRERWEAFESEARGSFGADLELLSDGEDRARP